VKNFILIVSIFLFVALTYSQEKAKKTTTYFEDGIFKNSLIVNTKLSEKWSFENKLQATYTNYFNQIEIPLTLKFNITDKLSLFAGSKINYMMVTDVFNVTPYKKFSVMAQTGARYDFTKDFFGEVKYEYDLMNNKNNYNVVPKGRSGLKLGGRLTF